MSYPIFGPVARGEEGWQCAPFARSCIWDIGTGPARQVVGSVRDSPTLAGESRLAWSAVLGNEPGSPYGGDCREAHNGGSAGSHPEGHAARTAAGIRPRITSSLLAVARAYSLCRRK